MAMRRQSIRHPPKCVSTIEWLASTQMMPDKSRLATYGERDGSISSAELHITALAFSGVNEDILVSPSIFIAKLVPRFASKEEDVRLICWGRVAF